MIPEERVLAEIKEYLTQLILKINELKVTEQERKSFDKDKEEYTKLIHDYKRHKAALIKREECLNKSS